MGVCWGYVVLNQKAIFAIIYSSCLNVLGICAHPMHEEQHEEQREEKNKKKNKKKRNKKNKNKK